MTVHYGVIASSSNRFGKRCARSPQSSKALGVTGIAIVTMSWSRVGDDLAKEVCRVIGRRRNSGGPTHKREAAQWRLFQLEIAKDPCIGAGGLDRQPVKKNVRCRVRQTL